MESRPSTGRGRLVRYPIFSAVASFLAAFAFLAVLVDNLVRVTAREQELEAHYWMGAFATKLRGQLEANLSVGYGVEAQISVLGDLTQADLDLIAARLLKKPLNIRHIAVAPNLVVSALYPREGNEGALGLNYRMHPRQRDAVLQAMQSRQVVLAGPLPLVQGGGDHLVARFPIYTADDREWGVISLVITIADLLRDAGLQDMQQRYHLALRNLTTGESLFGDAALFQQNNQSYSVEIPGGIWQLVTRSKAEHHWSQGLYWAISLLVSLLAAIAVFYLCRYHRQRTQHLQELEQLTTIDPLTQLTSRYQFNEYMKQLIEECERTNQGFTVLFIDLDHFKEINDSLGHAVGDELLIQVARTLKNCVRSYDLLCRFGGDEFIAILKNVNRTAEIENRARIITSCVAESRNIHGAAVNVTCSVGVAVYPTDGNDAASLIQHADLAMYESKRSGRNSLYFFNMSMRNEADRYIELSNAIKSSLNNNEFQVYYQPIYSTREERFTRCEALCRWPQADGSMISPMEFIPVAEQSGLICDLGNWVIGQVMHFYLVLREAGIDINFSINRSPQEFASRQHTQQLITLRKRLNIPPQQITLEITESLLMADHCTKSQNFLALREESFQFSIDDFGTGYSAINYLRQYPVESLKIDKSFIAELGISRQADTLVKVIIQMAKSLNIRVVAEGVETQQQVNFLTAIGCDYMQGYFFAKPMPREQFLTFMQNQNAATP
jgi:diguanylate cyclase (GGDEF)-like protein